MTLLGKRDGSGGLRTTGRPGAVTVRPADPDDARAIERLAGRDSRPVPPAPLLVAERGGAVEAALSLRTGAVVADPFRRTAELVELLRCHAAEAAGDGRRSSRPGSGRPRADRRLKLAGAEGRS